MLCYGLLIFRFRISEALTCCCIWHWLLQVLVQADWHWGDDWATGTVIEMIVCWLPWEQLGAHCCWHCCWHIWGCIWGAQDCWQLKWESDWECIYSRTLTREVPNFAHRWFHTTYLFWQLLHCWAGWHWGWHCCWHCCWHIWGCIWGAQDCWQLKWESGVDDTFSFEDTNATNNLPVLAAIALLNGLALGLTLLLALLLTHLRLHLRGARLLATAMKFVKKKMR